MSQTQVLMALILAYFPWVGYWQWKRSSSAVFPLVTAVSFMYWLYYAVPLFWGDRFAPIVGHVAYVTDDSITGSMIMTVLAVGAMWLGYLTRFGRRFRLPELVRLKDWPEAQQYVQTVLAVTTLLGLGASAGFQTPSAIRQITVTIQLDVPLLAYVILLRQVIRGRGTRLDIALIAVYLLSRLALGLAENQLGLSLLPALAFILVYLWERRKLPLAAIAVGLGVVLFLQPAKTDVRKQFGSNNALANGTTQPGSPLDRGLSWVKLSSSAWTAALETPTSGQALALTQATVLRTSLLTQTAHVLDWTPQLVPFQGGSTYTYLVAGLIPRFIWPDKPSFNDANQFYQVAYDLTAPGQLSGVSISAGSMTEGYINFSWPGVLIVMVLLGVLFDFVAWSFLSGNSGAFFASLGLLMATQFLVIESQLAVYLSGLVQTAVLAIVVFFPVLRFGSQNE